MFVSIGSVNNHFSNNSPALYQKVYPAPPEPFRMPPSFWPITTCLPCMAAIWAGKGATPGGGGGMLGGAFALNLAPASNCPATGP